MLGLQLMTLFCNQILVWTKIYIGLLYLPCLLFTPLSIANTVSSFVRIDNLYLLLTCHQLLYSSSCGIQSLSLECGIYNYSNECPRVKNSPQICPVGL